MVFWGYEFLVVASICCPNSAEARELFVSDPLALQSISANTSVWQLPSEVLA